MVETPKGSRSKYTYEPELDAFHAKGLLPAGMSFPMDFGFVPGTCAEDGDPVDILVLHDEPLAVGAIVTVRLLGVIEGEQTEDDETVRNDRLIGVTDISRLYATVKSVDDLGDDFLEQLTRFWVNFNALKGHRFEVLGVKDPAQAMDLIEQGKRG